jgi:hypothetical protein
MNIGWWITLRVYSYMYTLLLFLCDIASSDNMAVDFLLGKAKQWSKQGLRPARDPGRGGLIELMMIISFWCWGKKEKWELVMLTWWMIGYPEIVLLNTPETKQKEYVPKQHR